jgi:hypothetical protein
MVKVIGISKELPTNPKYFTQMIITEIVKIPEVKPDMEQLLSVMVEPMIISTKFIDTPCMKSYEGQLLSGKKLIIELKLNQKVTYVADEPTQSVHAAHFEKIVRSIFIIVPKTVNDIDIQRAFRLGKLKITPYIEDICGEMIDSRTISKCVTILVDVATYC